MKQQAALIQQALEHYIDPVKRAYLPRFFKTGKGGYGEGDHFLGVVVPHTRTVAKQHKAEPLGVVTELLQSRWHECRLCALLMLVERFRKSDEGEREQIVTLYLANTSRINNWDLVDLSAPGIVGEYLLDKPRDLLYQLVESSLLWEQRIAVVSTYTLIKRGEYLDTLALAERLLGHKHDLMHKSTGWMLREVGKRDKELLIQFLEKHSRVMPRTMLRYAIEKFSDEERHYWMKR
ncbi:MAG: DNA alkylation repair protein [Prevotellaceae bacterium]|nr:DNA alkylation repair protein [Prevotellaceae bacterium]